MTGWRKRTIMEMARRAGAVFPADGSYHKFERHEDLEAFAALVDAQATARERDACAKVCDELPAPDIYSDTDKSMWDVTCMDCAAAIRSRKQS